MCSKNKENKISNAIEKTLKSIQEIIDVNKVVGTPIINQNGKTIIPITKITLALLLGGGEYGKLSIFKNSDDLPYSTGNGTIISMKPCGFLVEENDSFKLIKVEETLEESVLNKVIDYISNLQMN